MILSSPAVVTQRTGKMSRETHGDGVGLVPFDIGESLTLSLDLSCHFHLKTGLEIRPRVGKYSLVCFALFCLVKRIVQYFVKE